jgi:hypothetical protein
MQGVSSTEGVVVKNVKNVRELKVSKIRRNVRCTSGCGVTCHKNTEKSDYLTADGKFKIVNQTQLAGRHCYRAQKYVVHLTIYERLL